MCLLSRISLSFLRVMCSAAVISLLFAADGGSVSAASADPVCFYQESTGKAVKDFQWSHATSPQEEVITVNEEGATFVNRCDRTGRTLFWHFRQGRQTEIQVIRDGNLLRISGILQGKKIDTAESIDDRPWYQPLSFSLRSFLYSPAEKISFWMVRTDSLEVASMQAEKKGVEEVAVSGRQMRAQKVEIRREGLLSSFWHAAFWFREADQLFVRYQGIHGPPGTRETVVQLKKELQKR